mmetsp:Transcript_21191/g.30337  ORF Transcript_21191/g.30337 Transcript_21191/m.30337 type:complete len:82 (-) Transcript_21191:284-529(-)
MVFKLLSKIVLPNLEKDLARTVTREVSKMELNLAPQVYGYRPKITTAAGGAFGTTVAPMMMQQFQKVDIPFQPNQGLFQEI